MKLKGLLCKLVLCLCLMLPVCSVHHAEAADLESAIYSMVYDKNPNQGEALWIAQAILYASDQYGVDPLLITAVMDAESGFHHNSVSRVGAIGLMQLMPGTAAAVGVDPCDPMENIIGGTIYLRNQLNRFRAWGEYGVTYAVAAYNAGPEAVFDYNGVPPFGETINYVNNVADAYQKIVYLVDG